jgi:Ca2+/H+ antiporter
LVLAEETGKALGMSQVFIGIVFVAIVGGAAESGSAVAMARKNKVCGDGQANWFKGVQLITVYVIVALMFYLMPATAS